MVEISLPWVREWLYLTVFQLDIICIGILLTHIWRNPTDRAAPLALAFAVFLVSPALDRIWNIMFWAWYGQGGYFDPRGAVWMFTSWYLPTTVMVSIVGLILCLRIFLIRLTWARMPLWIILVIAPMLVSMGIVLLNGLFEGRSP